MVSNGSSEKTSATFPNILWQTQLPGILTLKHLQILFSDLKTSSRSWFTFKLSKILPTSFFVYNPPNRRKGNHPSRTTLVFIFIFFPLRILILDDVAKIKIMSSPLFSIVWFIFYGSIFNRQNENRKIDKESPKMISLLIYRSYKCTY